MYIAGITRLILKGLYSTFCRCDVGMHPFGPLPPVLRCATPFSMVRVSNAQSTQFFQRLRWVHCVPPPPPSSEDRCDHEGASNRRKRPTTVMPEQSQPTRHCARAKQPRAPTVSLSLSFPQTTNRTEEMGVLSAFLSRWQHKGPWRATAVLCEEGPENTISFSPGNTQWHWLLCSRQPMPFPQG